MLIKDNVRYKFLSLFTLSLAAYQKETFILLLLLQAYIIYLYYSKFLILEKVLSIILLLFSSFIFYKILIAITFSDGVYSRSINPIDIINNFFQSKILVFTLFYFLLIIINLIYLKFYENYKNFNVFIILTGISVINVFFQIVAYRDIPPLGMRYGAIFNLILFYQLFFFIYSITQNKKIKPYKNILISVIIIFLYFDNYNWLKRNYKIQKDSMKNQ